jgi:diguanylate cyclase (GGDEF)-like protein/PAS domain S-box-containing protein
LVRELIESLSVTSENVLGHLPIGFFVTKPTGECLYSNFQASSLLGLSDNNVTGFLYFSAIHPDDRQQIIKNWLTCTSKGEAFHATFRKVNQYEQRQLSIHAKPFKRNNKLVAYVGVIEDVTEFNEIEKQLYVSQQRYELAAKGASVGIWDWDIVKNDVFYSHKFSDLLGFDNLSFGSELDSFREQIHPDDLEQFNTSLEQHLSDPFKTFSIELRMFSAKQQELWFHIVGEALRHNRGEPFRMVGSMSDITEKKQSEQVIWHQANFDSLTQLPNRNMFTDRLGQEIAKCKRSGDKFALLFIDLDHFKEVNDTLGHNAGDLLLLEVAERLKFILRQSDTVARLGGDEFIALLSNVHNLSDIEQIANKMLQAIEMPFYINGEITFISASIGITLFPEHSQKMDELLRFADQAMYFSKQEGRKQFQHFNKHLQEKIEKSHLITQKLRLALPNQEFKVLYQPILSLGSKQVVKAEALIRWHHPELGIVSPAEFIPLAETSGTIIDIGNWVFQQAAEKVKQWQQKFDEHFQISVNRSPIQFQTNLAQDDIVWRETLQKLSLEKGICIEITEGLLLNDNEQVRTILKQFHKAGVSISLDDFGTGYAALSYLTKFDIDYLKIDREFVRNLETSSENQVLCEAIIVMAHKLGLKVIAEGVETQQQLTILHAAACDYVQGYFISKPINADEFENQLASDDPFDISAKLI